MRLRIVDPVTAVREAAADTGVASRHDLRRLGVRSKALAAAVRDGRLLRPYRGVYCAGPPAGVAGIRAAAVALGGVASHQSAAVLWDLPLLESDDSLHVTLSRSAHRVRRSGVVLHWAALDGETELRDGVAVTSVARTLIDCARRLPLPFSVAMADAALARGLVTLDDLRLLASCARGPGAGRARRMVDLADERAESPLESVLRVVLVEAGLPPTAVQFVVRRDGRFLARADLAYEGARLLLEAEGFEHYGHRSALQRDCRRGNDYTIDGWRFLRFSWEDVMGDQPYVIETVRAALTDVCRRCA